MQPKIPRACGLDWCVTREGVFGTLLIVMTKECCDNLTCTFHVTETQIHYFVLG